MDQEKNTPTEHPLITHFRENQSEYHRSYFAEFALGVGDGREIAMRLQWRETPAARALEEMITIPSPFKGFLADMKSFSTVELEWLVDSMPSGWERAKIMEALESRMEK